MQYLRDTAFILKRINFADSDRFITLFTRNHGKLDVVAKGVRKITSRRAGSLELLNLVEFQAVKSSKNYVLTEVRLITSHDHLKHDLEQIEKVFSICEVIEAILPHGQRQADVFDLLTRAADKVSENRKNMAYFQAKLLTLLGFWDGKESFKNDDHVKNVLEQVLERKLKTTSAFSSA